MKAGDNFLKSDWPNREYQMSRFKMANKIIDFSTINSWLDIGCGTGDFFNYILAKYDIKDVCGIDIKSDSINISKKLNKDYNITYINDDFLNITPTEKYNLVTFSGILQSYQPNKFKLILNKLKDFSNNIIWIDTLNYSNGLNLRDAIGYYKYDLNYLVDNIGNGFKISKDSFDTSGNIGNIYSDNMIYLKLNII